MDPNAGSDVSTNEVHYRGIRGTGRPRLNEACATEVLEDLVQRYLEGGHIRHWPKDNSVRTAMRFFCASSRGNL